MPHIIIIDSWKGEFEFTLSDEELTELLSAARNAKSGNEEFPAMQEKARQMWDAFDPSSSY